MAGSNKQKWSYITKYMPDHFGRDGFKRPAKMVHRDRTINIGDIDRMVTDGYIQSVDKKYVIDLTAMGYDKLLGSGKTTHAVEIKVARSSKSAIERYKAQEEKSNFWKETHRPCRQGKYPCPVALLLYDL